MPTPTSTYFVNILMEVYVFSDPSDPQQVLFSSITFLLGGAHRELRSIEERAPGRLHQDARLAKVTLIGVNIASRLKLTRQTLANLETMGRRGNTRFTLSVRFYAGD